MVTELVNEAVGERRFVFLSEGVVNIEDMRCKVR